MLTFPGQWQCGADPSEEQKEKEQHLVPIQCMHRNTGAHLCLSAKHRAGEPLYCPYTVVWVLEAAAVPGEGNSWGIPSAEPLGKRLQYHGFQTLSLIAVLLSPATHP